MSESAAAATRQRRSPGAMNRFFVKVERSTFVRSVRNGLVSIIPVLIVGAFSLVLKTFPIEAYQNFISSFGNGILLKFFDLVYTATFGVLSAYMTVGISRAYMKVKGDPEAVMCGAWFSSLVALFMMSGASAHGFGIDNLGPKSMFLAIIAGLGASSLYLAFDRAFRKARLTLFSAGADSSFNRMLATLAPIALVSITAAFVSIIIMMFFDAESIRELLIRFFNWLFSFGENGFFKGFFFVLLSSILWFFGVHGSDTLEGVMEKYFTPGLAANQAAIEAGGEATNILTKQFFDCFVLMGGCGSAICLLIAVLIFSRNSARRGLGLTAAFPMVFNINEMMVFGLPIIYNPMMLIPFIATPLVCYSVSYFATSVGLVPVITQGIEWTTPVVLGGAMATQSASGAVLQVVNIAIGVLIYMPFVRMLDKRSLTEAKQNFDAFIEYFKQNESAFVHQSLTDLNDTHGEFAKSLCAELRRWVSKKKINLAYQPQCDERGVTVGVESLLRCHHPVHGMLYPPLVIKLADDGGFLADLEEAVVNRVLYDYSLLQARFGANVKVSFNVTGRTLMTPRFLQFLQNLNKKGAFKDKNLCLELTENDPVLFDESARKVFEEISGMGILLAIDDFSMGQTSIHYLRDGLFNEIKLDGSLVKEIDHSANTRKIIASIVALAQELNLSVVAEFVETEKQRDLLLGIGCKCYQGYLFSPAVFIDERETAGFKLFL